VAATSEPLTLSLPYFTVLSCTIPAQVDDPSKYGVVMMDDNNKVERFVEKPKVGQPSLQLVRSSH
jgi:NDP-sugar pyrophosphorylase family protein